MRTEKLILTIDANKEEEFLQIVEGLDYVKLDKIERDNLFPSEEELSNGPLTYDEVAEIISKARYGK